ncbi:MAG TPA: hypothetical protein VEX39_11215 [Thermoleophilaceae bacterium]|nr:hypothetical protein [Thermoleophilaceae bacterium]
MRKLIPACVALAALSLLLPSAPTYDPWSWIVWGREVAHLDLDTTGGPSWKPFPVLFTTVFSAAGALDDAIPPLLWLVVARAGALLALALVFRLARRLVGPGWQGIGAGLVAAAALACTPQWLRYAAHGNEAPMAVAAMLWAVERHLDGSRRAALALGLVACLMRPEVFPFLALYAAWAWRAEPGARRVITGGAVVLPVLWLVPEWIGSGQPFGAGAQARSEPSWSLSRLDHPWLELLARAHETLGPALEAGLAAALVLAWRRRDRTELALGGVAVVWVALVALMTESGFSGNARYLLPATVIACLLTGVALGHLLRSAPRSAPAALAATALVAMAVVASTERVPALERQARTAERTARLDGDLGTAVARMGGADAVVARGAPAVDRAFIPRMAWLTTLPIGQVERRSRRRQGLVFAAGRRDPVTLVAQAEPAPALTGKLVVGRWKVYEPR